MQRFFKLHSSNISVPVLWVCIIWKPFSVSGTNCIICGPVRSPCIIWGPWSLLVIFWSLSPSYFLCIDSSHSGSGHFRCIVFSWRTWRNTWEFFVTDFALSGLENFEEWIVIGGSHFFFEAHAALLSITASVHSVIFSDLYSG